MLAGGNKMPKKRKISVFIDGEPASLKSISNITHTSKLKTELGEPKYITPKEVNKLTGIKPAELQKWHKQGLVRATKVGCRWLYSQDDVIKAIKEA